MPGQSSRFITSQMEILKPKAVNNNATRENAYKVSTVLTNSLLIRLKTTDISRINSTLEAAESLGAVASIEG